MISGIFSFFGITLRAGSSCTCGFNIPARIAPGGICLAICAASIKNVPLPHIGSNKGISACQAVKAKIPAARFSFNGAAPFSSRQPLLNNASPEVSTYMVTAVGSKNAMTRTSGVPVSILGRFPFTSLNRSQMASLMRNVIKLMLLRLDFCAVTSTLKV